MCYFNVNVLFGSVMFVNVYLCYFWIDEGCLWNNVIINFEFFKCVEKSVDCSVLCLVGGYMGKLIRFYYIVSGKDIRY